MQFSRRALLIGAISLFLRGKANAWRNGIQIAQWFTLPLGAGGYIVGGDIAPDGTMVCKTDTYGCYLWNAATSKWSELITNASFGSLIGVNQMTGVWDIRIAPSQTTRFAMIFLNKVYRSDNSGTTWADANFSMTNAAANGSSTNGGGGAIRLANRKICIDPNNPDHAFIGTPCGVATSSATASGNAVVIFAGNNAQVASGVAVGMTVQNITNPSVIPGGTVVSTFGPSSITMSNNATGAGIASGDVIVVGNYGVFETFNFGAITPSWAQVASIAGPTAPPGCAGMVFDASSATTTVNGHTVTSRCLIPSGGNGVYETLDGGVTWNLTTGTPTVVWTAQIGPTGSYYAGGKDSASTHINVWRYVSSTWANIDPAGFANGYFGTSWGGGAVIVDPDNAASLKITGPNGGWLGYQTTNPDAGSVTWHGVTGGRTQTQVSSTIPWMIHGDTSFASVGDIVTNKVDGKTYFFEGIGVWKMDPFVYDNTAYSVTATSISVGIEQLVSTDFISSPGEPQPNWLGWDRPIMSVPIPNYPTNYDPPNSAQNRAWAGDYASDDGSYKAALITSQTPVAFSAASTNYGATGSWTAFANQTPAAQGGCIACASSANGGNIVAVVAGSSKTPVYTKNGGSTAWTACSGLPSSTYIGSFTVRCRVLAADRVNIGTFYCFDQANGNLYKSTDGGANFTQVVNNTGLPSGINHAIIISVPGQAGHLWMVDGLSNGPSSMWRWRDGIDTNWVKITACTVGFKVAVGATKPGASYPTLFLYGTFNGVAGVFRSTDQFVTAQLIATPATSFPITCQLDTFDCMTGDMNNYQKVYMGGNGSGGCYGVIP